MEKVSRLWLTRPGWLLAEFVALYAFGAVILNPDTYLELLTAQYIPTVIVGSLLGLVVVVPLACLAARVERPLPYFYNKLRENGAATVIVAGLFCIGATAFTTYKFHLVSMPGFYADPFFAEIDRVLHGGDPWVIAYDLVPVFLIPIIAFCYGGGWFLQWIGTVLYVSLFRPGERLRYLLAFTLVNVILGTILATLFSSAGPIFYDRIFETNRFADLIETLKTTPYMEVMLTIGDKLYESYASESADLGTGISAMPSVHVGIAALNALFYSSLDKWAGRIAWIYTAIVLLGSVYTGFHYAIDGYLSLLVVPLIWRFSGRLMKPKPDTI